MYGTWKPDVWKIYDTPNSQDGSMQAILDDAADARRLNAQC